MTVYELSNAILKLNVIRRKIASSEADILLESLFGIAADRMKLVPAADTDHRSSLDIAREEKLSFYDASYLSVAIERKLDLATDDKSFFEVGRKHVRVRT